MARSAALASGCDSPSPSRTMIRSDGLLSCAVRPLAGAALGPAVLADVGGGLWVTSGRRLGSSVAGAAARPSGATRAVEARSRARPSDRRVIAVILRSAEIEGADAAEGRPDAVAGGDGLGRERAVGDRPVVGPKLLEAR